MNKNKSTKKAYSLLEMLVTMAIFGIIIVLLLQSLLLNIRLNSQINLRSKFNSELDQLVSLIERDIRNADFFYDDNSGSLIKGCRNVSGNIDCTLSLDSQNIRWAYLACPSAPLRGCIERRKIVEPTATLDTTTLNGDLDVTFFEFFVNTAEGEKDNEFSKGNILVTIKAKPANPVWTNDYGITEQVRQLSISTRNYEVKL